VGVAKLVGIGLFIICMVIALYPVRHLAAPKWDVWVVTDGGAPLPGINVRLSYENYSTEAESHEITCATDSKGHVLFPAQFRSTTFLQRAFYTARSALAGVHASFGDHATVWAFGRGYEGDAVTGQYITDWTGSPSEMTSRIVAKRTENLQ
jgi:hypothetical protein